MNISLKSITTWLKKNYPVLAALGAILLISNYTGFNLNIPAFFSSLDTEGKVIFLSFSNFLITIVLFLILLGKINEMKNK